LACGPTLMLGGLEILARFENARWASPSHILRAKCGSSLNGLNWPALPPLVSPPVLFSSNLIPIFEKMMQFNIFSLNFLNQIKFVILNLKLWMRMIFSVSVSDIILVSILIKNPCFPSRNLTKMTKLYQF